MLNLSGYKIHGELGVGGQARVYLATQESFGRKVAIKVLLPQYAENKEFAERFLREAKTVSSLSHPHIIPVYDFGEVDGTSYMVMEYLPCGDLKARIEANLSEKEALEILAQLATALHQAHEKGFVHRDVKPDNIMFREDGSAVLTDFGIARQQSGANQVTLVGQVVGTPKYMSPEQVQARQLDGRADIYSLGIMFYEMLAKRVPYDHADFTTIAVMHCKDPIPALPGRFRPYQRLFERMVEKEPEKRFATALELAETIRDILSGKKDPESIESSVSLALKKSAQLRQAGQASASDVPKQQLPREASILLQELDPLLDADWFQRVVLLFKTLNGPQKAYAFAHYLQPKGIYHDKESKKLVFQGRPGVRDVQHSVSSSALQQICTKLLKAEEMLRNTREAAAFADLMESSISIIDNFDVQESLLLQKEKQSLRQAFLDDLILIVRGSELQVGENRRGLTSEIVTIFFTQVYLKQKMQGYRFRSTPVSTLEKQPQELISNYVAKEAKVRECDVIHTNKAWFLIGPVRDFSQNPFSARRFLHEDSAMSGQVVYFNVVAIPTGEIRNEKLIEHIKWSITRIVTLQRQLSAGIVELVHEMGQAQTKNLGPLLQKGIDADGTDLEQAIEQCLLDYEQRLSVLILAKLPKAVTELAKSQDDYEFLFYHLRQFIIQLACDIRDFTGQFATIFSVAARELDLKMMSFLALLDKRKDTLFITGRSPDIDPMLDPKMPYSEFNNTLDSFEPEIQRLKDKLREVVDKAALPRSSVVVWLEKKLNLDKRRITPDMVQRDIVQARKKCLVTLIRICKRYPKITVYVELEGLHDVDTSVRHYALPAGMEGLGQLPKLIRLYEDSDLFSVEDVRKRLNFSIMTHKQKWGKNKVA